MSTQASMGVQMLERALRVFRLTEAENARLKAERDLQKGEISLLREQKERLERDLLAEREARLERDDQLIDWLGQGRELLSADVSAELPAEPRTPGERIAPVPDQTARAAVRIDIAERLGGARERFGQAEFDRTYGGADNPV